MLIFTWQLAGAGDFSDVIDEGLANKALLSLVVLYGFHIFEIFTGFIGVIRANKKSYLALILGLILFVMNLWEFFIYANDVTQIILHAITLIVPYYYLPNAFRNIRS